RWPRTKPQRRVSTSARSFTSLCRDRTNVGVGAAQQAIESHPMRAKVREVKKAGLARPVDLEGLRESEERFRRTFELAGSGLAHIGMDRRFIRVNRRLCEILGYPEQELLKLRGKDISHPEDSEVINDQRPSLYAGEIDAVRLEKRYIRKNGTLVWVYFTMV